MYVCMYRYIYIVTFCWGTLILHKKPQKSADFLQVLDGVVCFYLKACVIYLFYFHLVFTKICKILQQISVKK